MRKDRSLATALRSFYLTALTGKPKSRAAPGAKSGGRYQISQIYLIISIRYGGESVRCDRTSQQLLLSHKPLFRKTFEEIDSFTARHGASSNCSPFDGCDDG
jgi:hypothetical protein